MSFRFFVWQNVLDWFDNIFHNVPKEVWNKETETTLVTPFPVMIDWKFLIWSDHCNFFFDILKWMTNKKVRWVRNISSTVRVGWGKGILCWGVTTIFYFINSDISLLFKHTKYHDKSQDNNRYCRWIGPPYLVKYHKWQCRFLSISNCWHDSATKYRHLIWESKNLTCEHRLISLFFDPKAVQRPNGLWSLVFNFLRISLRARLSISFGLHCTQKPILLSHSSLFGEIRLIGCYEGQNPNVATSWEFL